MNIKNSLRTILKIRVERELSPPGPKPVVGSNVARENLRMRLKYPLSNEQWTWLTQNGWRKIDMRTDRRRYVLVPERVSNMMLEANEVEREALHQRLIAAGDLRLQA